MRKLPELSGKRRKGGYGMYYHFDYVGGPRNYKWLNVSQIQRIWEQMNLTYRYGVDELWIVNVGDLKPMEYPIQFFMDMAGILNDSMKITYCSIRRNFVLVSLANSMLKKRRNLSIHTQNITLV